MTAQSVICPACKAALDLSTTRLGTGAKCPKCGGAIPLDAIPNAEATENSSVVALGAAPPPEPVAVHDTASSVAGEGSHHEPTADGTLPAPVGPPASRNTFPPEARALLNELNLPANEPTMAGGRPASADFPFLSPPQQSDEIGRLGGYRVLGVLGSGGMGAVFRAEDPVARRQIALKVMLPHYASNHVAKARFLREARAQAAVEHDNIIVLYQVAEEAGVPFIAMPLLKGQTLADALKANPNVPIGEAIRIAREMASGLAAAHEQHLIHRDIKPANVWLEGKHRRVKVLDFGLARAEADGPDAVTQEGMIIGTPPYMSPEQAAGEPLDARTDLFSLGVVLYQMLTGRQPFTGKSTPAILVAVTTHTPPHPMELNPQVPPELDALTMRLLAKSAVDRPANAEAVVEALRVVESSMNRTAQMPVVYYAPPAAAQAAPDPWAAIVDTEADAEPVEEVTEAMEASPASRASHGTGSEGRKRKPWLLIASLLAFVGVAAVAADIIIKVKNKDGTEVELKVPDGSTVTVTKNGKELAKIGPDPKKDAIADADRKAAVYAIALGGNVRVRVGEQESGYIVAVASLPKEPFVLTHLDLHGNRVTDADLAAFKNCKKLRGITLYDTQVGDVGMANFKDCKDLVNLHLALTKVTDQGLANFKGCNHIEILFLSETQTTDVGLANFAACKNLNTLDLPGTRITDAGLVHFKDCKGLQHLNLEGTQATDAGLANFKGCKNLILLVLQRTKVTDAGLVYFRDCADLERLALYETQITDAGLAIFKDRKKLTGLTLAAPQITETGLALFKGCNDLTYLKLSGKQVTDAALANFKDCRNLTNLYLPYTPLTDVGLAQFAEMKALTTLDLKITKVTEAGVKKLAAALPQCRIEWDGGIIEPKVSDDRKAAEFAISIGGWVAVNGTMTTINAVADLPKEPFRLTDLILNGNPRVTDDGLVYFKGCKNLTFLHLGNTKVSDAGLANFKDCTTLLFLDLAGLQIGDAGLAHFKGCKQLEQLGLNSSRVADAGLAHLKGFQIRRLNLDNTAVSDTGLEHLLELNLRSVNLKHTKVTEAGVKKLAAALPGCLIEWDGGTIEPKITDDRKAAEWVLSISGSVRANHNEQGNGIQTVGDLPKEPFRLTHVVLNSDGATDAGLAYLKGRNNLTFLNLFKTPVTDAGLAHIKDCVNLTKLFLNETQVTDAGLDHLKGLKTLTSLDLKKSKVTEAGVKKLAAALPGCKIEWDGGIIEPKK